MAMVRIRSEKGSILIDGEYGNIVMIHGYWDEGTAPVQIDVSEYRKHYGVQDLPADIDLQDAGYRDERGGYHSPCEEFRKAKATGETPGEGS